MTRLDVSELEGEHADHPAIGNVFPAEDPIARFVMMMCMARNDVVEVAFVSGHFNDIDHPLARHTALLTWAHLLEAMTAVGDWKSEYPEVKKFVSELPRAVRDAMKAVNKRLEEFGPSEHRIARNSVFHYPAPLKAQKECEGVEKALCRRANVDQEFSGDVGLRVALEGELKLRPCLIDVQPPEYAELPTDERDRDRFSYAFAAQTQVEVAARGFGGNLKRFEGGLKSMLDALGPFGEFADGCLIAHLEARGISPSSLARVVERPDL